VTHQLIEGEGFAARALADTLVEMGRQVVERGCRGAVGRRARHAGRWPSG
jgi:hypothetical protein